MNDRTGARARQLSLPSVGPSVGPTDPALPPELVDSLLARIDHDQALDALVYLRCPHCQWRKTVLVPRASRREPRLERLLPPVPLRHWVFSLGESAQPRLVAQPRVRTKVARACVAATFAWLRRAAVREGVAGPVRCGAVSAVHRVGAALEANVHVHALVLDGVYAHAPDPGCPKAKGPKGPPELAPPVFHPLPAPRRVDLRRTLAELHDTLAGLLARAAPSSATLTRTRAPVAHRVARPGGSRVVRPLLDPADDSADALVQRHGELDVRAGPTVGADDQALRARLCRYVARAPFDPSALGPGSSGRLRYRLHHPFADGTTHVELSPQVLAERLRALAAGELRPPVAFHGVLASEAANANANAKTTGQLALIDLPPRARSRTRAASLRCPRCRRSMEVVGVEPALPLQVA